MATPIPQNQCSFTLDEIASATGGTISGEPRTAVRGVTMDTRALETGSLFVALRGGDRDGHSFLDEAARRGAGGRGRGAPPGRRRRRPRAARGACNPALPAVEVDDTLAALGDLARHH